MKYSTKKHIKEKKIDLKRTVQQLSFELTPCRHLDKYINKCRLVVFMLSLSQLLVINRYEYDMHDLFFSSKSLKFLRRIFHSHCNNDIFLLSFFHLSLSVSFSLLTLSMSVSSYSPSSPPCLSLSLSLFLWFSSCIPYLSSWHSFSCLLPRFLLFYSSEP